MQETAKKILGPTTIYPSPLIPQSSRRLTALVASGVAILATTLLLHQPAWAQNAPAPAVAQYPTEQGIQPRQEPDTRTPTQRAAENYDAPGIRVGSFLLFPDPQAYAALDDNA